MIREDFVGTPYPASDMGAVEHQMDARPFDFELLKQCVDLPRNHVGVVVLVDSSPHADAGGAGVPGRDGLTVGRARIGTNGQLHTCCAPLGTLEEVVDGMRTTGQAAVESKKINSHVSLIAERAADTDDELLDRDCGILVRRDRRDVQYRAHGRPHVWLERAKGSELTSFAGEHRDVQVGLGHGCPV